MNTNKHDWLSAETYIHSRLLEFIRVHPRLISFGQLPTGAKALTHRITKHTPVQKLMCGGLILNQTFG